MQPSLSLPITHVEEASRTGILLRLAVLVPVAGSVLVPVGLVAAHASDVYGAARDNPLALAQLGAGIVIWCLMFCWPVAVLVRRFGRIRTTLVTDRTVVVTDRSVFGTTTRSYRLADFDGLAHFVRTSLGGVRHDLALVEPAGGRTVVFMSADRIARETVDTAARLLGLPEITAAEVVARRLKPALRGAAGRTTSGEAQPVAVA